MRSTKLSESGLITSAVSSGGKYAIVISTNHEADIWDLENQKLLYNLKKEAREAQEIFTATFNNNGQLLLAATQKQIMLWNVTSGKMLVNYNFDSTIQAIALSADGEKALVGLLNAKALLIDLNEGNLLTSFGHTETINSVALSKDGKYALTGSDDKYAVLWDLKNAKVIHKLKHPKSVLHVAFSPDGKSILTGSAFDPVRLWDLKTGKLHYTINDKPVNLSSIQFSNDGKFLALGIFSGSINVWQLIDDKPHLKNHFQLAKPDFWRPSATIVTSLVFKTKQNDLISIDSRGMASWWRLTTSPKI